MTIDITSADRGMIRSVLDNLREADMIELMACHSDIERLPDLIMRRKAFAFCAYDLVEGPVAIWGLLQTRPGVGAGFAFGTDRWGSALIPMVRQIRRFVVPFLVSTGYHRVEAAAMANRDDVARFMGLIGAAPEAVLRGFGVSKEDFILYRWLADEHRDARIEQGQADLHAAH
jgi:hypothetical protein